MQQTVTAKNFSEASENRIHSDEIAKKFGFKGALVPGVADRLPERCMSHSSLP